LRAKRSNPAANKLGCVGAARLAMTTTDESTRLLFVLGCGCRRGQQGAQRRLIARRAKLLGKVLIAHDSRDARKRLQVIGAGSIGREQQENQNDRHAIERFEIDRLFQARKKTDEAIELCELAVRNCNAAADAGRAEPLAVPQRFKNLALTAAALRRNKCCKFLQRLFLVLCLERGQNRVRGEKIVERHD
jgi:hypothetical protein